MTQPINNKQLMNSGNLGLLLLLVCIFMALVGLVRC